MGDGSRVCPGCGSLHPDDVIDIMWRYSQGEEGYDFDPTEKGYKIYAHRPDVKNAGDGGIKFYNWHLPEDRDEFDAAWSLAAVCYKQAIAQKWNGTEAYWVRERMPGAPK